jgi:Na+-transporting NADH:ubiquinone oxidoreductase subunit NqrA
MTETFAYDLLRRGAEQVIIKPRGHSMEPLIMDRQQVTVRRLQHDDVLAVGDIVLARVRGNIYLHKITAIDGSRVQISSNHGRVNGWTHRERIAGRLVA